MFRFTEIFLPKSSPAITLSIKSLKTTRNKIFKKIFTSCKIFTNKFPFTKSYEL